MEHFRTGDVAVPKLPSECGLGGGWNLAAVTHCSLP